MGNPCRQSVSIYIYIHTLINTFWASWQYHRILYTNKVNNDATQQPSITKRYHTQQLHFSGRSKQSVQLTSHGVPGVSVAHITAGSRKLAYGSGTFSAVFPSSVGFRLGGQSYSNFLASTVED